MTTGAKSPNPVGRPATGAEFPTHITVRVTHEQKRKFLALGASEWCRERIDRAAEPAKPKLR